MGKEILDNNLTDAWKHSGNVAFSSAETSIENIAKYLQINTLCNAAVAEADFDGENAIEIDSRLDVQIAVLRKKYPHIFMRLETSVDLATYPLSEEPEYQTFIADYSALRQGRDIGV